MHQNLLASGRREALRLEVVALASELATVALLIGEDLSGVVESPAAQINQECTAIRSRAHRFLGRDARFEALSDADLAAAASELQQARLQLMDLWSESKALLRRSSSAHTRW